MPVRLGPCDVVADEADAEVATTTYEVFLESEESLSDDSNGIRIKVDPSMNEVSIVRVVDTISTLLGLEVDEPDARVIKFAPRYKLVFTLLNQNASRGGAVLGWDIDNLLDRTLLIRCETALTSCRTHLPSPRRSLPAASIPHRDGDSLLRTSHD